MPPPTEQAIAAALDALRDDAAAWLATAAALSAAADAAPPLDGGQFGAPGDVAALTTAHAALRDTVAGLLAEGARAGAATAAALFAAADAYDREERAAVHRLHGIW
jgi:hypothetical protein